MKYSSFLVFFLFLFMMCLACFSQTQTLEISVSEETALCQQEKTEILKANNEMKQNPLNDILCVVGGFIAGICACVCAWCFCKRKQKPSENKTPEEPKASPQPQQVLPKNEQPDYVNPSDEWMRFFYKDYDVKLQQWEARFYQRIFSMQLLEGVFILLWVLVAVCWVIWDEENNKKWMLGFIGIGISLAGVINALCLLRANRQLTAFRQKNREKQKEYFDKCHGKAFTALRKAKDKREYPDEMQKTTSYCWWIHLIGWIVMLIIIGIALFLISIK